MQPFENFQKLFFKHSNLRKVNCVAYFVVLRREPIKWAQCMKITNHLITTVLFVTAQINFKFAVNSYNTYNLRLI
jgi:hypothetical protein